MLTYFRLLFPNLNSKFHREQLYMARNTRAEAMQFFMENM